MFLLMCTILSMLHICLCADLTYTIEEGKSPGTYLGDIAADLHIMESIPHEE